MILGNKFLCDTHSIIDFENKQLFVNPKFLVRAEHDYYLLPKSEEMILLGIIEGGIMNSAEGIMYGHNNDGNSFEVSEALVQVSNNHIPVVITNRSETT